MKNKIPTLKEIGIEGAKAVIKREQDGDTTAHNPIHEALSGYAEKATDDEYDQMYFEVIKQYERMVALRSTT